MIQENRWILQWQDDDGKWQTYMSGPMTESQAKAWAKFFGGFISRKLRAREVPL